MKTNSKDLCECCGPMGSCCMKPFGLIHVAAGVGMGFLLVEYLGLLDNLALLGWALVGVGMVGHFWGKNKCNHCMK